MTLFSVWAPAARVVTLVSGSTTYGMDAVDGGWWTADLPDLGPGSDYAFLLDGDPTPLPDPRSRWQPAGVHGPSRVYDDAAFSWTAYG